MASNDPNQENSNGNSSPQHIIIRRRPMPDPIHGCRHFMITVTNMQHSLDCAPHFRQGSIVR